jgi:hypothetical protein
MKYALLIYSTEARENFDRLPEEEQGAIIDQYVALYPASTAGSSCSRRVGDDRARGEGRTLTTDGPFADTKEVLGDFDLAEEAAQEAFAIAAARWPRTGAPENPRAWLVTTARNRAIDRIRRDRTLAAKTKLLEIPVASDDELEETTFPDERLELVFTCCHPALALEAQVALTLCPLGGLTTDEIGRAFLVDSRRAPAAAGPRRGGPRRIRAGARACAGRAGSPLPGALAAAACGEGRTIAASCLRRRSSFQQEPS